MMQAMARGCATWEKRLAGESGVEPKVWIGQIISDDFGQREFRLP
ncbi:hypothetical protein [Sphingopyxis sp. OPL5]|nr:hypothetical protein [Sphingopyxis sp. OPL5]